MRARNGGPFAQIRQVRLFCKDGMSGGGGVKVRSIQTGFRGCGVGSGEGERGIGDGDFGSVGSTLRRRGRTLSRRKDRGRRFLELALEGRGVEFVNERSVGMILAAVRDEEGFE